MNLFKRRGKVDIQIIKVEPLQGQGAEQQPAAPGVESKPGVLINIVGKQQLSGKEWLDVAGQIAEMALPDIVQEARQARQAYKIDEAILMLRDPDVDKSPEVEAELLECLKALGSNIYFQRVPNSQLAAILFGAAGFQLARKESAQGAQAQSLIETRLTFECADPNLRSALEKTTGAPQRYDCYCLAEFGRPLDDMTLGAIQQDYAINKHKQTVNRRIHFAVCKDSSQATNMIISIHHFEKQFVTIPLEREEMRRAVINGAELSFLRGKIDAWMGNPRLFANTRPVTQAGEFFGRVQDVHEITSLLQRGESFCIVGGRRMGKTSLIYHLRSLDTSAQYLWAILDLEGYLDHPNFDRAVQDLLSNWSDELKRKQPVLAKNLLAQIPRGATPPDRLSAFLEQMGNAMNAGQLDSHVRCLAILDDLNFVLRARGQDASLWERGAEQVVRSLRHRADIVVSGLTMWDFAARDTVEESKYGSGSGKYTLVCLGPLRRQDCDKMICDIGGIIGMEFKPESLEAIYAETGGHPLWVRLICDAISATRRPIDERMTVSRAHVEKAVNSFISRYKGILVEFVDSLPGAEQRMLRELARQRDMPLQAELASRIALDHLKDYGLVEESPSKPDRYRLGANLLVRYLQS